MNNTETNEQNTAGVDKNKKYKFSKTIEIINILLAFFRYLFHGMQSKHRKTCRDIRLNKKDFL